MNEFNVCVYCASRDPVDPAIAEMARELGRALAGRGWGLVYGGGRVGLMGQIADAVMGAGGRAVGVIPRSLVRREVQHAQLTEQHVVDTMHDRKRLMAERADAFIALPGGIGTFEEIFEAWTWRHLGYHRHPLALLDIPVAGASSFWDPLLTFLDHTVAAGFMDPTQMAMISRHQRIDTLLDHIWQTRDPGQTRLNLI